MLGKHAAGAAGSAQGRKLERALGQEGSGPQACSAAAESDQERSAFNVLLDPNTRLEYPFVKGGK